MVTITDLVLASKVFGRPRNVEEQDFGLSAAGDFQGAMRSASWRQPYSDAREQH
jgi:hypothetical protein